MNIKNLIAKGRTGEALELLNELENGSPESVSLLSRWNRLKRSIRIGVVTPQEANVETNKINDDALDLSSKYSSVQGDFVMGNKTVHTGDTFNIGNINNASNFSMGGTGNKTPSKKSAPMTQSHTETYLLKIIKDNKRRRPEIAKEAKDILGEYRAWKDKREETPSFDPSRRRLQAIQKKCDAFLKKLSDEKMDSLEEIVAKISELIEDNVPIYEKLAEAYKLASGRGLKDYWIEQQLKNRPDDEETRIQIAERIEEFTEEIQAK